MVESLSKCEFQDVLTMYFSVLEQVIVRHKFSSQAVALEQNSRKEGTRMKELDQ